MNYFVVVLPMAKDGSVNRQILAFTDLDSAKQSFHSNCGKYFKNDSLKMASVCILDEYCNNLRSDYWKNESAEVTE